MVDLDALGTPPLVTRAVVYPALQTAAAVIDLTTAATSTSWTLGLTLLHHGLRALGARPDRSP
jgi:hypothetical protein